MGSLREAMRRLTCAVLVVAVWAAAIADAEVEVLSAEEVAPAATAKTKVAAKPNLVQKAHKFVEKRMDKHKETHKKLAHTFGQKVADPHPLHKIFHEIDHMEGPRKKDFPKHKPLCTKHNRMFTLMRKRAKERRTSRCSQRQTWTTTRQFSI